MDATQTSLNLFERFNNWLQESIMVKLLSIGFMILILLIPSAWIQSIIEEREQRADDAMDEVASRWSGAQTLSGPVLVIPYKRQEVIDRGKDGKQIVEYNEQAFFLPEQLSINGNATPEILHRGIFDAVVYHAKVDVQSQFATPDFKSLKIREDLVQWADAYLAFGITDLRGISENPKVTAGTNELQSEPSGNIGVNWENKQSDNGADYTASSEYKNFSSNGIVAKLPWVSKESFNGSVKVALSLKGSRRIDFIPAGKTTNVTFSGNWKDPSFDGEFIPESRTISDQGFSATWKVLHFNRAFAQQWTENDQRLINAQFGVRLLVPVDQYQKSIRTAKYGILIILLTFIALFLVEIIQKIRIHPFQYILIGAALTIYYTLLLSISEHLGYNLAYLIASSATVILVALYAKSFLREGRLTLLFTGLLTAFYGFIFVIIQEQDYSLMLGSIGLFVIVAVIMYFSRKISWYRQPQPGN